MVHTQQKAISVTPLSSGQLFRTFNVSHAQAPDKSPPMKDARVAAISDSFLACGGPAAKGQSLRVVIHHTQTWRKTVLTCKGLEESMSVWSLSFSPDGKYMCVCLGSSWHYKGVLRIYKMMPGEEDWQQVCNAAMACIFTCTLRLHLLLDVHHIRTFT